MKTGINQWCFPNTYTVRQSVAAAAAAGFDGIELNVVDEFVAQAEPGDIAAITLETTADELEQIRVGLGSMAWSCPASLPVCIGSIV